MSDEELAELKHYAQVDGTESGEFVLALLSLIRYSYALNSETIEELNSEMRQSLDYYRENTRIVTMTESSIVTWEELHILGVDYEDEEE